MLASQNQGLLNRQMPWTINPPTAGWGGGGIFASDEGYAIVEGLREYGETIDRSVLDIAIGWLAAQPFVSSVIAGVTKPEQIRQNVASVGWQPTVKDLETIAAIAGN